MDVPESIKEQWEQRPGLSLTRCRSKGPLVWIRPGPGHYGRPEGHSVEHYHLQYKGCLMWQMKIGKINIINFISILSFCFSTKFTMHYALYWFWQFLPEGWLSSFLALDYFRLQELLMATLAGQKSFIESVIRFSLATVRCQVYHLWHHVCRRALPLSYPHNPTSSGPDNRSNLLIFFMKNIIRVSNLYRPGHFLNNFVRIISEIKREIQQTLYTKLIVCMCYCLSQNVTDRHQVKRGTRTHRCSSP